MNSAGYLPIIPLVITPLSAVYHPHFRSLSPLTFGGSGAAAATHRAAAMAPGPRTWCPHPLARASTFIHMLLPTLALGLRSSRMLMCDSGAAAVLSRCALDRDAPAAEVLATLEQLDRGAGLSRPVISAADLQGHRWELIFSSAAAKLPTRR